MAGIMSLPLEIRIMIYEYCLIVDHTIGQCSVVSHLVGSRHLCHCSEVANRFGRGEPLIRYLIPESSEALKSVDPAVTLLAVSVGYPFTAFLPPSVELHEFYDMSQQHLL